MFSCSRNTEPPLARVGSSVLYEKDLITEQGNKIKTKDGPLWLSIPVKVKGKYFQKIKEAEIDGQSWKNSHWKSLKSSYSKAPFFEDLSSELEKIYFKENYIYLSELNRRLIELICNYLEITTKIRDSSEFNLRNGRTERLVNICKDGW